MLSAKLARYLEETANWENREELVGVLSRTTHITVLFIWFAITLTILWIDMWIFLGWLWFWLWFTLKIFLSNFIAWIIMVTQWTYHNWDLIQLEDGKMWNIKRIQSLFTAVQQFDGVIYYVPNVKFLEENVSNYNSNDKRRVEIHVWVDYDTDLVKAKKIMMQVIKQFPNVLISPEPMVTVDKLADSWVNMILRFWILADGWDYLKTKSNVTETIHLAFRQSGITIPFPQVTLSNRSDFTIKNN
jgi:small conductance mechanosensitive channel